MDGYRLTASPPLRRALREPPVSVDLSRREVPVRLSARLNLWLSVCLVILMGAAVVLPRSYFIAQAHSETLDETYHLKRGLFFLNRSLAESGLELNDPPLGEALVAIPLYVTNLLEGRSPTDVELYNYPGRAEKIAVRTALWNSSLFIGFLAVVFTWCHQVYGTHSAWIAVALFLVEPNFAAHVPIATLDVLGVEGIVIGAFLAWRYFERPSALRLVAMGFGVALALSLKHTAIVLPAVLLAFAGLHWFAWPWFGRDDPSAATRACPGRARVLTLLSAIVMVALWALTLFDFSSPMNRSAIDRQVLGIKGAPVSSGKQIRVAIEKALHLDRPWPAGCYLGALRTGLGHALSGHLSYLNGERREQGWWNYYPIVASYKVPIAIAMIFILAALTLAKSPPRWAELGLFVPMLAWTLFMLNSKVNLGFRHFLPPYAFMLMIGSRCVLERGAAWSTCAWTLVIAAGVHSLSYHPDYLCYMNLPYRKPYLAITDCNVDWGQSLKQVAAWLDAHPLTEKTASLYYFGNDDRSEEYYLSGRVVSLDQYSPRPTTGLLIISPVRVVGAYEEGRPYEALRAHEPDAVIGNSMLVYDLDRLRRDVDFRWPAPK